MKKTLIALSVILVGTVPMCDQLNIGVEQIVNSVVGSLKYYPLAILSVGIYLLGLVVKLSLTNNK
ncbi:MAG: hypothetical protein ACRC0V_10995 [Fusobacteriaceae bacterium]